MAPIVHSTVLVFVYLWQVVYVRTCQHSLCYFWLLWNHNTVSSFFCQRLWGLSLDSVNESTWSARRLQIHSWNLSRRESGCETKENYLRRTKIRQMYWRRRSSLHTSTSITQPMEEYSYVGGGGEGGSSRSPVLQRSLISTRGSGDSWEAQSHWRGAASCKHEFHLRRRGNKQECATDGITLTRDPKTASALAFTYKQASGSGPPAEPVYTTSVMWLKVELEVTQLHALLVPPLIYIFGYLRSVLGLLCLFVLNYSVIVAFCYFPQDILRGICFCVLAVMLLNANSSMFEVEFYVQVCPWKDKQFMVLKPVERLHLIWQYSANN